MPTQNISNNTPDKGINSSAADKHTATGADKPSARAAEGVSKIADGASEVAGAATSVAADKARQVRDQVEAAATQTQAKASSLTHDAASAAKHAAERVESTARDAVAGAKEIIVDAKEGAGDLLHGARDVAVESYESAREFALEVVDEATETAQQATKTAVSFVRRASLATGRFVSLHALPLAATGASLGWLLMSMSKNRKQRAMPQQPMLYTEDRLPQRTEFAARPTHLEVDVRLPSERAQDMRASRAAPTTTGSKLMGVRVPDNRYKADASMPNQRPTQR